MNTTLHLTPAETAARLRRSVGTLANWRVKGGGPPFIKMGGILYPLDKLEAWEKEQTRTSTAG